MTTTTMTKRQHILSLESRDDELVAKATGRLKTGMEIQNNSVHGAMITLFLDH